MGIHLLILLCAVGGLRAANDYRNQTVECSFIKMDECFGIIPSLGGNVSSRFAEKPAEMVLVCQSKGAFQTCIQSAPPQCNAQTLEVRGKISGIEKLVNSLCSNTSAEYNNFLNSSVCYNRNQKIRQDCVKEHASKAMDAKSLCCKSKKIQECLETKMNPVCPKNSTGFQTHVEHTYNLYTDSLCGIYFNLCNGAVSNVLSAACILLTAKIVLLNQ